MNIKLTLLALITLLNTHGVDASHKRTAPVDYEKLKNEVEQFAKEHTKEMAFIDALNLDDEHGAEKLLQEIDVNTKDYRGVPLLMIVVNRGNPNILNTFLSNPNLKINALNKDEQNVILYLINTEILLKNNRTYNAKEIIMVLLLLYGASTNITDNNGNSFDKALEKHEWVRNAYEAYFKTLEDLRKWGMVPEPD